MKNTCWIADGVRKLKRGGEVRNALLFACNGDEMDARKYAKDKLRFTEIYSIKCMNGPAA